MLVMQKESRTKELLERLRQIQGKVNVRRRFISDFKNKEFLNWTNVSKADISFKNELIPGAGALTVLIDWCNDNCQSYYVVYQGELYFQDDTDAAMFIMVWK
jgi:hypothetical protein